MTPTHIVPEWYYLPFYAILRAVPNKLGGVALLGAAIVILAFLPWLDRSKVRSARYRPRYRFFFWLFFICLRRPRLARIEAGGRRLCLCGARADDLLLRALPGDPAAARPLRDAATQLPGSITESVLKRGGAAAVIAFAVMLTGLVGLSSPSVAAEADTPPKLKWSFGGPFGKFDRGQLAARVQGLSRGLPDLSRVSILVSFRNLADPGGPGFTSAQAAAVAAEYQVPADPDDQGEVKDRPARLADRFPPPFKNENQARARYNGVPPDLSVIVKARGYDRGFPLFILDLFTAYQEQGADYMVALLTGYADPPKDVTGAARHVLQQVFPGPFPGDAAAVDRRPHHTDVTIYDDGTKPTADQLARDVTAFLAWAAEPHLEARKRSGCR